MKSRQVSSDGSTKEPLRRGGYQQKWLEKNHAHSGVRHGLFKYSTEKKRAMKERLEGEIPESHRHWIAYGKGDCFYDSVAIALNVLRGGREYDIKSLRLLCDTYATELDQQCNADPNHADNWLGRFLKDEYQRYLANVRFTVEERARGGNNCVGP